MIGLLIAAVAAAAQAAPAPAPPGAPASPSPADQAAAAQIRQLEQDWGQAFVKRDFDFLERIIAPEYRLVGARPDGTYAITGRAEWMKNSRAFTHQAFLVETVDVNLAGDTAVASAQGLWTVSRRAGEPPRPSRFFVTDTWVRRNGQWQVIHRYSHRLPDAPWPPVARPEPAPK
jgi:ketosteroid isomerase-like protein